ncbi:phosphoglycerate dehydrogenase [Mesorhizobium sp. M0933]|uniref:NAD(P)-dependent oxidoreductase n=1 Tax=Mesorhizobium sp. M0933 TaxID=2957030 RepID=UPI003334EE13
MKVLCLWYATEEEKTYVRSMLPAGTEVVAPEGKYFSRFDCNYADVAHLAPSADAIIAFSLPNGLLPLCENLKIFSWMHTGVDDLRSMGAFEIFKQRGIQAANVRGANTVAVAEQAMMFVLALAKKTVVKHRAAEEGKFLFPLYADEHRSAMLHGRTIGVIGVGTIGSRVAKHAKGFDMKVLGVRRSKDAAPVGCFDAMFGPDELHDVLSQSDYVVLAAPDTPETRGFIGAAELDVMKRSAFLVNVSRAALVQEDALYEALTSGQLRGYATDVPWLYNYGNTFPYSWGSRLNIQKLPNVITSNDQAANADDVLERDIQFGTENVAQFFAGKPMERQIRLDLGY